MAANSENKTVTNPFDILPLELILMITPYLSAKDLLSFCATTKETQNNPEIRESATYWSDLAISTFRVPNHPVVEHDGRRWMQLYRRMRTQTKVFGWGNNDRACFGLDRSGRRIPAIRAGRLRHGVMHRFQESSWPKELDFNISGGQIADLQCGGWSTVVLSTRGVLSMLGLLDGLTHNQAPCLAPKKLEYPPGYVNPSERYDSHTTIRQFSTGRSHILGLSDSGRIWSWHDANRPAVAIKFLAIDILESDKTYASAQHGAVRNVVASWNRSSAYIYGTGIVVWLPSNESELRGHSDQSEIDTMVVMQQWIVPHSGYLISDREKITKDNPIGMLERDNFGEVKSYTMLVEFVVFVTALGKLFAAKIPNGDEDTSNCTPFRVSSSAEDREVEPDDFIADVQGAFESFAVFKRNGEVLISNSDFLSACHSRHFGLSTATELPTLRKIPSLQNSGVIAIAFGDWHFQALHANGTISSYGRESQLCGCLGLGDDPTSSLRGLQGSGNLLPQCETSGRRVQFEREKQDWLFKVTSRIEARSTQITAEVDLWAALSEQIETRLDNWTSGPATFSALEADKLVANPKDHADDGLAPYFALSVAAAGWHSGALVLVNTTKAEAVRASFRIKRATIDSESSSSSTPQSAAQPQQQVPVMEEPSSSNANGITSSPIIQRTLTTAASYGRRFLGLPGVPGGLPRRGLHSPFVPAGIPVIEDTPRTMQHPEDESSRWIWDDDEETGKANERESGPQQGREGLAKPALGIDLDLAVKMVEDRGGWVYTEQVRL